MNNERNELLYSLHRNIFAHGTCTFGNHLNNANNYATTEDKHLNDIVHNCDVSLYYHQHTYIASYTFNNRFQYNTTDNCCSKCQGNNCNYFDNNTFNNPKQYNCKNGYRLICFCYVLKYIELNVIVQY